MKIHMRIPPMPSATSYKPPPTAFLPEMQAEELARTTQLHQARLKKLYGAWKSRQGQDEDDDSENGTRDHRPDRTLDFLAVDYNVRVKRWI